MIFRKRTAGLSFFSSNSLDEVIPMYHIMYVHTFLLGRRPFHRLFHIVRTSQNSQRRYHTRRHELSRTRKPLSHG